jgi:alpha-1,3-mannosylglycoprotein beta-1,4-N-acetylglucosaminyltransferase A/B
MLKYPPTPRYLFRSGNAEHPADRFYNTTVEILPVKKPGDELNVSPDGFVIVGSSSKYFGLGENLHELIVGKFDTVGIAEGFINPKLFPIKELRLNIHSESDNWVILNEVKYLLIQILTF